jgi:2-polyprenyl-3-methyl-5-hydroxy-6-metoxy-1,4-benzoquinol methylase
MSMSVPPKPEYVLGHGRSEMERLALQAQYWGEATLELLQRAGIAPGMRILDLGCGAGDVSLLAAALVGSSGSVVGIDSSADAVAAARARVNAAGLTQVELQVADLEEYRSAQPFDGVVGRFVLLYLADPAVTLRRLVKLTRPGGFVAFLEMDLTVARSVPSVALVEKALEWLRETFRRARVPLDLGPQAWRIFRAAGLSDPSLIVRWKAEPAPGPAGTRYLVETIRSLLPVMERFGVASACEVDIDTLGARLQEALVVEQATMLPPCVVGTWSRVGA